jgi:hypothetical protein
MKILNIQYRILFKFFQKYSRIFVVIIFGLTANQCCGSGMFIPDLDFLSIPDPTTKHRGKKLHSKFFSSHTYSKSKLIFFEQVKKFQYCFYPKILPPQVGLGIRKNLFPHPGIKKAPDPGSATLLPTEPTFFQFKIFILFRMSQPPFLPCRRKQV